MKTIQDVEMQAEEKLSGVLKDLALLPEGYRLSVRLHGRSKDKKRNASFETSWSPDSDSVYIKFEPIPVVAVQTVSSTPAEQATTDKTNERASKSGAINPLSDLIRALDRAESRPGFGFIALKWFRDTALVSENFSWASLDSARRSILSEAIEKRMILLNKIPNPKSPQFPVTAIRLNRLMPEVKAILGNQDSGWTDFQPVTIRGENLSATVLRDRR